jgi:predicted metal-dependent phosphoesterase TrpH
LLLDMHVHTTAYSDCAKMSPDEMAERAREVGLDGAVITEHNTIWSDEEIADLRERFPDLALFRGVEVSAKKHHVLLYGLTDFTGFEAGMPVQEVVALAHERGAVAVWAHPLQYSLTPHREGLQAGFDACETRSVNIDRPERDRYRQLAQQLGIPEMANSDSHHTVTLGAYATRFWHPVRDEKDIAEAIRQGAFTPEERLRWSGPASAMREELWHRRIRGILAKGVTDPVEIKRRSGASLQRIRRIMEREASR